MKEVSKLKLQDIFIFTGFRRDIANFLHLTDIFVLPSFYEGLGISVLEAMAAGKAVITTNIDGINEAANTSNSIVVHPRDHYTLAAAIEELIISEERRKELGEVARKWVESKFSIKQMCLEYENLYKELIA